MRAASRMDSPTAASIVERLQRRARELRVRLCALVPLLGYFALNGVFAARTHTPTVDEFVYVPAGGIHAFRNESGAPASMLLLFAPGAPREPYFQALADAAAAGRVPDIAELYRQHDSYAV